jgi:hypothetical protein
MIVRQQRLRPSFRVAKEGDDLHPFAIHATLVVFMAERLRDAMSQHVFTTSCC